MLYAFSLLLPCPYRIFQLHHCRLMLVLKYSEFVSLGQLGNDYCYPIIEIEVYFTFPARFLSIKNPSPHSLLSSRPLYCKICPSGNTDNCIFTVFTFLKVLCSLNCCKINVIFCRNCLFWVICNSNIETTNIYAWVGIMNNRIKVKTDIFGISGVNEHGIKM